MTKNNLGYFARISNEEKKGKRVPSSGDSYIMREIVTELAISDAPCFRFLYEGEIVVIQTSHMDHEDMAKWMELAGDRMWKYDYTTSEWIPLFFYDDVRPITGIVDIEREILPEWDTKEPGWWAIPKGFPRKQYYDKD